MAAVSIYPQRVNGHRTIRPWKLGSINLPKRRCIVCREWFKPGRVFQKFCSPRCRRKPKQRKFPFILCRICRKRFKPTRSWQQYCSYSCRDIHHLHPKRKPFESMRDCLTRAKIYQSRLSMLWRKMSIQNGLCRSCSKVLMKNSRSWCRKHWFMQLASRYGFNPKEWRIAESILRNQNYKCALTGIRLILGVNASLDHKKPKSKYPNLRSKWNNVHWVDWYINNIKQTLSQPEFIRRLRLMENKKAPRLSAEGS